VPIFYDVQERAYLVERNPFDEDSTRSPYLTFEGPFEVEDEDITSLAEFEPSLGDDSPSPVPIGHYQKTTRGGEPYTDSPNFQPFSIDRRGSTIPRPDFGSPGFSPRRSTRLQDYAERKEAEGKDSGRDDADEDEFETPQTTKKGKKAKKQSKASLAKEAKESRIDKDKKFKEYNAYIDRNLAIMKYRFQENNPSPDDDEIAFESDPRNKDPTKRDYKSKHHTLSVYFKELLVIQPKILKGVAKLITIIHAMKITYKSKVSGLNLNRIEPIDMDKITSLMNVFFDKAEQLKIDMENQKHIIIDDNNIHVKGAVPAQREGVHFRQDFDVAEKKYITQINEFTSLYKSDQQRYSYNYAKR